jgi:hypothetical protein
MFLSFASQTAISQTLAANLAELPNIGDRAQARSRARQPATGAGWHALSMRKLAISVLRATAPKPTLRL